MRSKILFFSFLLLFFSGIIGCSDKFTENQRDKHIVPFVPIRTEVPLWMAEFQVLKNPYNAVYIRNSYPGGLLLGYKNHGIIIYSTGDSGYKCWDATCTKCTDLESGFTATDIKGQNVVCPKCGTEFYLLYGMPFNKPGETSGEKIYPLKEYPVTISGNTLIINYQ